MLNFLVYLPWLTLCLFPGVPSLIKPKDLMQGKLFQRCTHILYCSVLSLGSNVKTWRMSKPDMGSIFHINNQTNTEASILVYKFRPEKTGFNMYAEYTQLQLTFLALHSWELPSFRMKNWGKKTCKVHHCFTSRASLYAIIAI